MERLFDERSWSGRAGVAKDYRHYGGGCFRGFVLTVPSRLFSASAGLNVMLAKCTAVYPPRAY